MVYRMEALLRTFDEALLQNHGPSEKKGVFVSTKSRAHLFSSTTVRSRKSPLIGGMTLLHPGYSWV